MHTNTPRSLSIIIIDKSYFDRYFLRRQLELMNNHIRTKEFSSGKDALNFLESVPKSEGYPQFAIIDISVLLDDGIEVLQGITQVLRDKGDPRYVSVLATGSESDFNTIKDQGIDQYIDGFIPKPVEIEDLKNILKMSAA